MTEVHHTTQPLRASDQTVVMLLNWFEQLATRP